MRQICTLISAALATLICSPGLAKAQGTIHLADGDNAGLFQSLASAEDRVWTRIRLAPGGRYTLDRSILLSPASGDRSLVEIDGNGALIILDDASVAVGSGATLRIADAEIRPMLSRSPLLPNSISSMGVSAGGELALERSAVIDGRISGGRFATVVQVSTGAKFSAENVTFSQNTLSPRGAVLANYGETFLINSTVVRNVRDIGDGEPVPTGLSTPDGSDGRPVVVKASILDACSESVVDAGGNLSSDVRCGVSGTVSGLELGSITRAGSLVPTLPPLPWSAAVGAAPPEACLAVDARGLSRLGAECDAGAHQSGAGPGRQDVGGINGTWFQPENDGHYVVVNRNTADELVVIWMTFDKRGNQAWVYSVADFDGRRGSGAAFVNREGVLDEDGVPRGQTARAWGTMSIEFASCNEATLRFESETPEFGSGVVTLSRLSEVNSIGCSSLPEP